MPGDAVEQSARGQHTSGLRDDRATLEGDDGHRRQRHRGATPRGDGPSARRRCVVPLSGGAASRDRPRDRPVAPARHRARRTGHPRRRARRSPATRSSRSQRAAPHRRAPARRGQGNRRARARRWSSATTDASTASRHAAGLSYLPFVARAVIDALREFPLCNATVAGDEITTHDAVHLGIAVDLDHVDLVVPVVHDAHTLRLRALASRIGERRAAAHASGTCNPTTSPAAPSPSPIPARSARSSPCPCINIPQVAILATDAVRPAPGRRARRRTAPTPIAVHPVGVLALGFDGRVRRPHHRVGVPAPASP